MNVSIADAGFVLAVGNRADAKHHVCAEVYRNEDIIYLTQPILTEIQFILRDKVSRNAALKFLREFHKTKFRIIPLTQSDMDWIANWEGYDDIHLGFVDASTLAVAERLGITRLLTLEHFGFSIILAPPFKILP